MWSAEALLPVAGAACALRFEPELGDWSCWKLWMDKNDSLHHREGGPEVQLRAGQLSENPPGHPYNLEENNKKRAAGNLFLDSPFMLEKVPGDYCSRT